MIFLAADMPGLFHITAPAVDTAYTPDCSVNTQYCAAYRRQFLMVGGIFQLLRRIGEAGKGKGLIGGSYPQTGLAGRIGTVVLSGCPVDFQPVGVHMHTAVLRNHVRCYRQSVNGIDAVNTAGHAVGVSFTG